MMNLRRALGLAVMTLLPLGPATAQETADDPLLQDAREYAKAYEVEVDEALRRLRAQAGIGKLNAELLARERATFGGLFIQHDPSFRVVAQFTPKGGQNLDAHLQALGLQDLAQDVERRTVRLPLRRLEALQAEANRIVRKQGLAADSRINVAANRVELVTEMPADLVQAITAESRISKLAADLRLPEHVEIVGVDSLPRPQSYIVGGVAIDGCTAGFVVQSGGTLGISTAGHCNDHTNVYQNRALPYVTGQSSGSIDSQWHTAPGLRPTNRIWDGQYDASTPYYRHITSYKTRAQQVAGEFVCKYGITTAYTCGTIVTTSYTPSFIPGATATYVFVDNYNQNLSEGGDSGGPWFSGETAYGIHSGGGLGGGIGNPNNAAIYGPVDGLIALGANILTTNPDPAVGRWTYKSLGNNISYSTMINAADYECSVAGFAAIDGDINEGGSGDIIQTYLYQVDGHWYIRGDFRTHNDHESWDFDLLCLKKANYPVTRYEWNNLGGNINYNTGLSTTTYDCGIAGMAAIDGDIDEGGSGNLIQSYMYRSSGTWRIRADFHSHNDGESWDIDAMCVQKWAPVFKYEFTNVGNNVTYNTGVSSSSYVCGVAGIAAIDGDINENGSGDIIQAYLYESGGTWWFRGDIHSHNNGESWNFDMLCFQ